MIFLEANPAAHAKTAKLELFTLLVLGGFLLGFAWHTLRLSTIAPLPMLFPGNDRFNDFFNTATPYPPLLERIILLFNQLPPLLGRWLFLLGFGLPLTALIYKAIKTGDRLKDCRNLLILLFSYPVLFTLDRGNFEILVFLLVYFFAVAYQRGRRKTAIACLAFAIAIKPFPAVFLGLLAAEGELLPALIAAGVAAVLLLLAALTFPGTLLEQLQAYRIVMATYNCNYLLLDYGLPYTHSLFSVLKLVVFKPNQFMSRLAVFPVMKTFYFDACILLAGALVLFHSRHKKYLLFWEITALYVCAMNLLPFTSPDYKLLHLLIPFLLFINETVPDGKDRLYTCIFGLLFTYKCFIHYSTYTFLNEGVIINPLLMCLLSGFIMHSAHARKTQGSKGTLS